jgi:hypothetical protein
MKKVEINAGKLLNCPNTENSTFLYEGKEYDVVFNDFMSLGGDHFILDGCYAFETN